MMQTVTFKRQTYHVLPVLSEGQVVVFRDGHGLEGTVFLKGRHDNGVGLRLAAEPDVGGRATLRAVDLIEVASLAAV